MKEHERARYDFDPTMFYENRFWNRRPDSIVINKCHRTLYILKFKRSSDRNKDFLGVKEDKANDFCNKLEKLNVEAEKRDKILLAHVQRICEAHDTVMRSY